MVRDGLEVRPAPQKEERLNREVRNAIAEDGN